MAKSKPKVAKGPTGGPMSPGASPKPDCLDRPANGCNPIVKAHPTARSGRRARMNGGC